ncbi:MAG: DUF2298 domain-containing protein [Chloroflexia bacterium]
MTANPLAQSQSPVPAGGYPPASREEPKESFWVRYRTTIALLAILILAGFFRFYGRDFDQDTHQHPDERFIVDQTMGLTWPTASAQFFDVANSPLNLRRAGKHYPYGSLPVYLTKGVAWAWDQYVPRTDIHPAGWWLGYEGITKIGRMLAALFDLITVLLVFLIARRLYSRTAGLIAAALVGFAVTHIQIAHFYASDAFLVTFMMGALYFAVVLMQRPSWRAAVGVGLCLGLAVASKVSVVLFAVIVIAAIALRAGYRKKTRALGAEFDDPIGVKPASAAEREMSGTQHFIRGLRYLVIAGVCALLAFAISEPYVLPSFQYSAFSEGGVQAVLNSSPFWGGIVEQAGIQSGHDENDVPYTRQYVGTIPILYHMQNLVFWGMSPIPGVIVVLGFLVGLWYAIKRRPAEILLLAGAIPYWATILIVETKWMRYVLPLVPIYCILGAAMLMRGAALMRKLSARSPWLRTSRRPMAVVQRNLFAIVSAVAVGAAFLWAVAFMNIYSQEHSRVQASRWIMDFLPTTIQAAGADRPAIGSKEGWDDELPLGVPPKEGEPPRQVGALGPKTEFGLYDDRPGDAELQYIQEQLSKTDYIYIASNRIYGSIRHLPWRYPVQDKFYELLYEGKLGFELVHTQMVTPQLLGINFPDQTADESFTVYDHPRVDVFKKNTDVTADQLHILFQSALTAVTRPGTNYSTARHGTVTDDLSLAYDVPIAKLGDLNDYAWNPLAQPDTQWLAVILWFLAIQVVGIVALPLVLIICRRLPDRGYPLAKLVGLLLLAWGVWTVSSAKLIPFTVWGVAFMLALLAGLSWLCWRLGARALWVELYANKKRLIVFYEVIFLAAFLAFLFVRMLNPDLWHPSLGGEKPMEFGFLNAVLRTPWMPPADPFFAQGYVNYYYYGQFIMGVMMKLIGVDPGLGINLAIPMLYGLTFTAGASIVYNIVARAQRGRGSEHAVSRAGMAFGFLSGFLMLAIGNMGGAYELLVIWRPDLAAKAVEFARQLGFTEQSIVTPPLREFDFWGPSRIVAHTINEFPFWSFLFADFHPHLIDMPFTLLMAALCLNLAFAGPFRSPAERVAGATLTSRIGAAFSWLWGEGWSGALMFGVTAVGLGTLFATNSWDFPTFAAVAGGAILIALLLAGSKRSGQAEARGEVSGTAALEEPSTRKLDRSDRVALWGTGIVTLGLLAAGSLLACLPFLLSFKNVLKLEVRPLVDGGVIPDTSEIMHRTTVGEYLMIWVLFVFVASCYLIARLWAFPWRAAASELGRMVGIGGPSPSRTMVPEGAAAFSLMPAHEGRLVPAMAGASPAGMSIGASPPITIGPSPMAFSAERGDGDGLTTEPVQYDDNDREDSGPEGRSGRGVEVLDAQPASDEAYDFSASSLGIPEPASVGADMPSNGAAGSMETYPADGNGHVPDGHAVVAGNWLAEAHQQSQAVVAPVQRPESPGVIPLWAGLGLLGLTVALVGLQLATGQWLLALLAALAGGIMATSLATSRSASALTTSMLLFAALAVSAGVEVVYLADHLRGGDMYRMNTVFKFYIQVWLLYGAGSAAAIYYILYGVRERMPESKRRSDTATAMAAPAAVAYGQGGEAPVTGEGMAPAAVVGAEMMQEAWSDGSSSQVPVEIAPVDGTGGIEANGNSNGTPSVSEAGEQVPWAGQTIPLVAGSAESVAPVLEEGDSAAAAGPTANGDVPPALAAESTPAPTRTGPLHNWLVWSDEDTELGEESPAAAPQDVSPAPVQEQRHIEVLPPAPPAPAPSYVMPVAENPTMTVGPKLKMTPVKIAFSVGFLVLLAMALTFTWNGTIDRVSAGKRFPQPPAFGTLDGRAYMETGQYGPINSGTNESPGSVMINLKYDYEAIQWLNQHVPGLRVIMEGPYEYYRDGGMRVAANTGLPMIVGGLHQGEQRYDWLVGERDGDARTLLTTQDPQVALTILSKYDVDYIYLGQLEQARAGAGLAKFAQLADPKVGVLTEVFRSQTPSGIKGTIIYQVNKGDKAPSKLVGAPVQGSGVAGVSITPLPTMTPTPVPTPPTNNPELKGLMAAVAADPTNVDTHMKLVDWYRSNNYWPDAVRELEALVVQRPQDIAVRHQLGDAYDQLGQKDNALKAYIDARDIDPKNAAGHNKLGIAYLDRHKYDDAEKSFNAAVQADPAFTEAYLHLAEVYVQKGNVPKAKEALQSAIDKAKEPDDPWAKEARTRLAGMK